MADFLRCTPSRASLYECVLTCQVMQETETPRARQHQSSRVAVTFEAGDKNLHRAGILCGLLRTSRWQQGQESQANQHACKSQVPHHHECRQDAESWKREAINSDGALTRRCVANSRPQSCDLLWDASLSLALSHTNYQSPLRVSEVPSQLEHHVCPDLSP